MFSRLWEGAMSKTVLEVHRRELGGPEVSVRLIHDGGIFRYEPADFSDDADSSLAELLRRSGTLLHVGAHNCLHVKTWTGPAEAALYRSLQVVGVPEPIDPAAWPASDKHAAEHAEEDEEWGWADAPEVLTRWLEVNDEYMVIRLAAGQPVVVAPDGALRAPEPLISGFQFDEQLELSRLPDGQLISVAGSSLEVLHTEESVADWLRGNLLDSRFALQVFDTDLDPKDMEFLMEASTGFRDTTRLGIDMSDDEIGSIVDKLCVLDESRASLRTAVEEPGSDSGLRLRDLVRQARDNRSRDELNAAYEGLREWFEFL
jgi:hypothetical protein